MLENSYEFAESKSGYIFTANAARSKFERLIPL